MQPIYDRLKNVMNEKKFGNTSLTNNFLLKLTFAFCSLVVPTSGVPRGTLQTVPRTSSAAVVSTRPVTRHAARTVVVETAIALPATVATVTSITATRTYSIFLLCTL